MTGKARPISFLLMSFLLVIAVSFFLSGCSSRPDEEVTTAQAPAVIEVTSATAVSEEVSKTIEATGSFIAKEASDVAPKAAGRVIANPVEVGDFVRKGQVIVRLDDSDARLRLQQAQAQLEPAQATVRQAQSKLGIGSNSGFDPTAVPEARAAKAAYESALAQARLAEADARRYSELVETGDVSQSNYQKFRTQAETAKAQANAAKEQYETALNAARQGYQGVATTEASLSATKAQVALAQDELETTRSFAPPSMVTSAHAR